MKRSILACWAFVTLGVMTSATAQAPILGGPKQAFVVSSVGEDYPFTVSLRGLYQVFPDSVVIEVAEGVVVSQIPANWAERGRATNVTLVAALGRGTTESWTSEGDTPPIKVGAVLPAGGRLAVPPMRFAIRWTDTLALADRWIAIQLGVVQHLPIDGFPDGALNSYACTEDYVLGPTPASRLRAQAQRKRYSTVC